MQQKISFISTRFANLCQHLIAPPRNLSHGIYRGEWGLVECWHPHGTTLHSHEVLTAFPRLITPFGAGIGFTPHGHLVWIVSELCASTWPSISPWPRDSSSPRKLSARILLFNTLLRSSPTLLGHCSHETAHHACIGAFHPSNVTICCVVLLFRTTAVPPR